MNATKTDAIVSYPRFLWRMWGLAFTGSPRYYVMMTAFSAVVLVGLNAWAHQLADGMIRTSMTDQVSWGLYIANFTFGVGLAAGAVMMVIPAYLYDDEEMHHAVLIGELLAIAAIVVCIGFIAVDMGRPDRFWHIIPGVGRFNWPISMLTWDVLVLNGYLLLNLHITGYLVYMKYLGRRPNKRWYLPFVFLSIAWAISIHSVTAFLYSGLGGRPFWNSALLAPRFIASAFISGPAFVILLFQAGNRFGGLRGFDGPVKTLASVLRITILVNMFMFASEQFTEFYTGGAHTAAARHLFFGLHGANALVPWTWSAIALNLASAALIHSPQSRKSALVLSLACACAFSGVWIEKGMGLIIPAFIPSTLHEISDYRPTMVEWKITAGVWAFGAIVLSMLMKMALPVLSGQVAHATPEKPETSDAAAKDGLEKT